MIADAILVVGAVATTIIIGGLLAWRAFGKLGTNIGDKVSKDEAQRHDDGHRGAGD